MKTIVPDVQLHASADYKCELGNSSPCTATQTIHNISQCAGKTPVRMSRVETTGAHRFENTKAGFIWIGIPAKGLLLDSQRSATCKRMQRLHNKYWRKQHLKQCSSCKTKQGFKF
jgi:hypothetical protein